MTIAVIATGGKQYLVREGETFEVEHLQAEPETQIDFTDLLHGKTVKAIVLGHDRADKVRVVKFRSKVRYLRRRGHRQAISKIRVESIQ